MAGDALASLKITIDANGAVSQVTVLNTRLNELGSTSGRVVGHIGALDAMHQQLTRHTGEHGLSLNRLERNFGSVIERATGLNSTLGLLGETMAKFGLGDLEALGILGGIALVATLFDKVGASARKAREEQDKLIESLEKAVHLKGNGPGGETVDQRQAAIDRANELLAERYRLQQGLLLEPRAGASPMAAQSLRRAQELARQRLEVLGVELQNQRNLEAGATGIINEKTGDAIESENKDGAEAALKADAAFQKRIEILTKGMVFDDQRKKVTAELVGIEHQLEAQINSGTASLEKRIQAMERLAVVQNALSRKFLSRPNISNVGQLIGVTGDGETGAARFDQAYDGPMKNVKYDTDSMGFSVKPGQTDFIGNQMARDEKALAMADKNAKMLKDAIWGSAAAMAGTIVSALNFGGGGKGSSLGGSLGATAGFAAGMFFSGGSPIGGAIGSTVGNIAGSLIGGLFDHHKKAIDNNTQALNNLAAKLDNAPSGYKIAGARYQADDGRRMYANMTEESYNRKLRGGLGNMGIAA